MHFIPFAESGDFHAPVLAYAHYPRKVPRACLQLIPTSTPAPAPTSRLPVSLRVQLGPLEGHAPCRMPSTERRDDAFCGSGTDFTSVSLRVPACEMGSITAGGLRDGKCPLVSAFKAFGLSSSGSGDQWSSDSAVSTSRCPGGPVRQVSPLRNARRLRAVGGGAGVNSRLLGARAWAPHLPSDPDFQGGGQPLPQPCLAVLSAPPRPNRSGTNYD